MGLVVFNLLASIAVLLVLLPPYIIGYGRMTKARELIAQDPQVLADYSAARGGLRPVLIYLAIVAAVVIVGLGLQKLITTRIEPAAFDTLAMTGFWLIVAVAPVIIALILIGMLISLAATSRARSRYLDRLTWEWPDAPHFGQAAELLRGGRNLLGVAGAGGVAVIACLFMGLAWIALLFSVASYSIQCVRSGSKCL